MARLLKYKIGVGRRLLAFLIAMLLMTSYINIISPFISFAKGEDIITETESQKITNFSVHFVSGADNIGTDDNPDYVWVATKHDAKHRFVYQMDYDLSGEGFLEPNTVQFVIPKYIIKDRNNNWANNYELAIPIDTDVPENDNENIFVYKEDGNNILVYNRLQVSAAEKGSIQFAYDTNKSMLDYVDMRPSEILYAEFNIDKNVNEHLHTVDDITRVKIDTTATIGSSSQSCELYETWKSSWGNASDFGISNPDDYYYLYWKIKTKISFVTQPYTFRFNSDTVTGSNGNADFVAVRMGEYGKFSSSFIDSNIYRMVNVNGEINQYVITKHLKSTYGNLEEYYIKNSSVISLHPIDNIDSNTEAISSGAYNMKKNNGHAIEYPITSLYFMKHGYIWSNTLSLKNQPVNYELSEFTDNNIDNIHNNMSYNINMSAYAYLFTIQDGYRKEDTEYYGCKDIKYSITDEDFYLNDSITDDNIRNNILPNDLRKLTYNDFEITSFNYGITVQGASWVDYRFVGRPATSNDFENNNTLDFYAKFESNNNWIKIGSKNMKTNAITKDDNYVKYFSSDTVEFKDEVSCVGIKVETSNKLYSTSINIKPKYKLKNSDYVKNIANTAVNSGDPKIWVTNKANCKMSVDDTEFFNSDKYARNIIVGYIKVSHINKNSSFVNINKVKKLVNVGWNASVSESYNTQNGICYVKQESGKFYDLLPVGSDVNKSTITVEAGKELNQSDYDVQTITNYKGTGRTLLIINIKVATETQYNISYSTVHSMESLYDYGTTVRNTLAYETGNNVIANGFADNGGDIIDADIMNDLDSSTDDSRFIYTDSSRILDLLFAVNSGLTKMVKASSDIYFSRNTTVHQSNYYTYRLRYANDSSTRAKNIIFYDNIENYTGSVWQGELQSIDVSQIKNKGVSPIIYLSDKNVDIGVSANRNLTNDSIWTTMDNFGDLSKAKSIAIDLSKKDDNSDFVLNQSESVVILLNMLSPDTDPGESLSSDKIPAKALNSIYLDSDMMTVFSGQTYNHNLLHWYKDTVEYKTMGDVLISKVDARDNITPVKDISFSLIGVSNYGTVVSEEKESDINGLIDFKDIEKGSYTLTETSGSKDYQKINETINVVINADGSVSYNGNTLGKNARYVISDEPRIHTDIKFTKRDITNKNKRIAGVKFHLYGNSEYNNFVSKTAVSDNYGNVVFEDVELGHYELEELTVADGYVEDNSIYKVFINEQGKYSIDDSIMEKDGTLSIYNEPYHSFTIQKESFTEMVGIAMPVEGAVFILVGNSDRGTSVNMTRTSGANGKLTFSGLESGSSYILKEIEAPDGYAIDDVEHIVKITKNGNITISGLNKNSYGEFVVKDKEDSTVTVTKKWVDNETNETRTVEPKIHLGVNESAPVAYFGSNLSSNNTSYYGNSVLNLLTSSNNIKAFKPFNGTKSEAISAFKSNTSRRIDDGTTDYKIYAWYISDSRKPDYGTVYWWSDAKVVYLTDKSHELFSRLGSVKTIDVSGIDVSKVTDMSNMFYNDYNLNNIIGLDNWDVSNVTDMSNMFYYCPHLTSIELLENWDTSNVIDMSSMFSYWSQLESIEPLENWDTSNVTDMSRMFYKCSQLTSIEPLENWNVSNVTNMSYMFYNCSQLTSIEPLENWDTSNVTDMKYMFYQCSQLTSIEPLENWNTSNVTDMQYMFYSCNLIKHIDLHNWDVSNVTNMSYMFSYCSQLTSIESLRNWNVSNVTDMSNMFSYCSQLTSIESLRNWNVSNVTDMSYMFSYCSQLTSIEPLRNWDVSNVTDMSNMFSNCSKLTSLQGLENWDVSNVIDMSNMFSNCSKLTSLQGLENWDTSNVTDMRYMFSSCSKLTSLQGLENWDVSNVTDMSDMFNKCSKIESIDLSNWNTVSLTNIDRMFYSCSELTYIDLSNWNINKLNSLSYTFYACQNLVKIYATSSWDRVNSIYNKNQTFYSCINLNKDGVSMKYNTSKISGDYAKIGSDTVEGYFRMGTEHDVVATSTPSDDTPSDDTHLHQSSTGKAYFKTIDGSNYDQTYVKYWGGMSSSNISNVKYFRKFTGDLSILEDLIANNKAKIVGEDDSGIYKIYGWFVSDTSAEDYGTVYWWSNAATVALKDSARGLFSGLNYLIEADTEDIDVSEVNDFSCTFNNCYNITTLNLRNWVTNSSVFSTSKMFYSCKNLESIQGLEDFNMQNVNNTGGMFYCCSKLTSLQGLENWDVSNVTNISYMFYNCSQLTSLQGLENWDVSNVTDMSYMFCRCSKLTSLQGLENWDVSNVTDMSYMFSDCSQLTSLQGLENWDISNVTTMYQMFCDCSIISIEPLENWNTSNAITMQSMFSYCRQLTSIQGLEDWDVSNVTDMRGMFYYCIQLTSLQGLENWNVSNVTDMSNMFYYCRQLTSLQGLEDWNVSNVTNMSYMFSECSILVDASELRNWDVSNVTDIAYMFYNCYKLINLDLSKWEFNSLESMRCAFYYCDSLRKLDVSNWGTSNVSDMSHIFCDCRNLIQIKGLESWNTINVKNMSYMFYNCNKLTDFNISNWCVDNIDNGLACTFNGCSSVKTIDLSGWAPVKLYRTDYMFCNCDNLETIYVSDLWDLSNCSGSSNMFYNCNKLTGEKGTKYDNSKPYDKTYAHIDRLDNPGYLTYKKPTPKNIVEVYDSTDERCQLEKATDDNWYYTFTELDPSLDYYTWEDEMENYTSVNMTKSKAVGIVDGTATITNKTTVNPPTFGSLKISKNILNNDGTDTITSDDASKQFLFIISFVDGEDNIPPDNIYDIIKTHDGVESTTKLAMIDGKLQLLLSDNDIAMIRDIPTGYKYTITEALDDKFTMSVGSGALTGTITENKVSTTDILNTKVPEEVEQFVTFKLKKVVVGNYIDASEKFTFSLNFTGLKPNEIYNIISNKQSDISYKANKNGVGFAEVELIDGEELTITVPKDSVYVISESGGNYISSYKIIDNAGLNLITKSYDTNFKKNQELSIQSETADLNEDIEITFTNKKLETQKLTLQKELINVSSSNSDMFDFTVEITDLEDGTQISSSLGTLTAEDSNEIVVQFPLAANTPVEFYNIPVNAKYKITEAASDYIASYKIYDTEHNELESGANTEVNKALETGTRTVTKDVDTSVVYTNKKVSCDITIRKEIDMKYGILTEDKYRYTPFTFDISLTGLTKPLNQIDVQYIDDSITGVVTKKLSQVLGITDESANEVRSNVNLTVELFNGQAIKIKDMPKNATCSVKERASDNYIASYKVRGNDAAVIQAHDTANDVKNMELSMDAAEVVDNEDTDIVITFTNQYEFPPYELPAAGMNNYWYVLYWVAFIMLILTLAYTYSSYKRRQEV